ncbi:MAG: response regulator [Rubrobacter sp.]|nr:response regulator [Rubrobacter sp.]
MDKTLRILIVEDSEDDALLLLRQLRRSGYEPVSRRVDTPESMESALDQEDWDVVTTDYNMPRFGPREALSLLKRKGLDLPLIVVSGQVGEEVAVSLMKEGVHDYVSKSSLSRLGPAVVREVREAKVRREGEQAQEQLRQSMDALLAIYEASQLLSSTLETEEIGTRLLEIMRRISNLTTAVISVPDEHRQLRVWRAIGFEVLWHRVRYTPEAQAALYGVLETGEYQLLELQQPDHPGESLSTLYLPLRMRERIHGVLEIYGPEDMTQSNMVEILVSLTSKAASALENARIYRELAERESQLQELVGKLITAQEEERRRVAYDVHDGMTQLAVASYQHLQAFTSYHPSGSLQSQELLDRATELVRQTVEESRKVIANLRPTALDDFGLAAATRLQVEALWEEGWEVTYEESVRDERMPYMVETVLYRVVQEALVNVRKHVQTSRIHVELEHKGEAVRLRVRDWGRGFEATEEAAAGPGERVGISGMRERVALVGGEIAIESEKDEGTSITVYVPLPESGTIPVRQAGLNFE